MDKQDLLVLLKRRNEVIPDEFDGSYSSVRTAVKLYSYIRNVNVIDYNERFRKMVKEYQNMSKD